jgi:hypothetical protein
LYVYAVPSNAKRPPAFDGESGGAAPSSDVTRSAMAVLETSAPPASHSSSRRGTVLPARCTAPVAEKPQIA